MNVWNQHRVQPLLLLCDLCESVIQHGTDNYSTTDPATQQQPKGQLVEPAVTQQPKEQCPIAQRDEGIWYKVLTIKARSEKAYHRSLIYQASNMSLTNFDAFPSLTDFSAAATADALKWTDLEQHVVYQIVNTGTVNTRHGQSIILSFQKADGSSCSAWACGMLSTAAARPMIMVSSRLFVLATGRKTSKNGRVYNSYQLMAL